MQKWRKLGRIFSANKNFDWMQSHASVPIVLNVKGDEVHVIFTCRDKKNQSSVASIEFNIKTLETRKLSKEPLLSKGDLGQFDDSGVMASCILNNGVFIRLYYIGWNLGVTVPFRNSIGLAESKDFGRTFVKKFKGPVLDRTKDEPHFVASSCVIYDENIYKIWYLSCTEWFQKGEVKMHKYHIKYAESKDGIDWDRKGIVAIDYSSDLEYAISVPRVIKEEGIYKMWFSSRANKMSSTYGIRYAESLDGIDWIRKDNDVSLGRSKLGWDSEMICYPFVFSHKGSRYMLYNGNGYGESGFGLAVLEN